MPASVRAELIGKTAFWLLDFELGARPWRFSTECVRVVSRADGREVTYQGGLASLDVEIERDAIQVQIRAQAEDTWARSRRRYGPMTGRPFVLRRWVEGTDLEDAYVVLQGVVGAASYGAPGDPAVLGLKLERALRALSDTLPSSDMRIEPQTHDGSNLYLNAPSSKGQVYPIVIGFPGFRGDDNPGGGSPAFVTDAVSTTTLNSWQYLIAGHRVTAANVSVWDKSQDIPTAQTKLVQHGQDDLGRTFAYFLADGNSIPHTDDREILIGWAPSIGGATGGSGLKFQGDPVRGLGDLLAWGARFWMTSVEIDWNELTARRATLNRYKIDAVINDATNWLAWLESEIYDLFEIEEVNGPHGLYWREIVYDVDPVDVRARLTTKPSGRGFRVSRSSGVVDSKDDVLNQISLEFRPIDMSTTSRARRTIGPDDSRQVGGNAVLGGAQDESLVPDPRARVSLGLFGLRSKTLKTVVTAHDATAEAILRGKIARHALPAELVEYRGGAELADLRKFDTIELEDSRDGAFFPAGTLALVWSIAIEDQDTFRVLVRIPYNPLRDPGTAQ